MATPIFTLEALNAAHGDCLMLHYGTKESPRLILIDGGPTGTYSQALKPRLDQIFRARAEKQLEIRLMMLSHIDDDHIRGLLDLTDEIRDEYESSRAHPYDILSLWHNSFDDVLKPLGSAAVAAIARHLNSPKRESEAVASSVPQGRRLRLNADALSFNINPGFDRWVSFPQPRAVELGEGLQFSILGPRASELTALQEQWSKQLMKETRRLKSRPATKTRVRNSMATAQNEIEDGARVSWAALDAETAAYVDRSITNLSSIVVLAQSGMHSMLLTGDARGDLIVKSLKQAKMLKDGVLQVDVLKAPHHGSSRDVEVSFFETIQANHYVFSANGKYDNPDKDMFKMLFEARPKGPYTIWLTNHVDEAVEYINRHKPKTVLLRTRKEDALSVKVELEAPIST